MDVESYEDGEKIFEYLRLMPFYVLVSARNLSTLLQFCNHFE